MWDDPNIPAVLIEAFRYINRNKVPSFVMVEQYTSNIRDIWSISFNFDFQNFCFLIYYLFPNLLSDLADIIHNIHNLFVVPQYTKPNF